MAREGARHGIGDVVELQIEEDRQAGGRDPPITERAIGQVEFQPQLQTATAPSSRCAQSTASLTETVSSAARTCPLLPTLALLDCQPVAGSSGWLLAYNGASVTLGGGNDRGFSVF